MRVRIRDIAAKAGVSPATVSNALNGCSGVSAKNTQVIFELAERMGYTCHNRRKPRGKNHVRLVILKRCEPEETDLQYFVDIIKSIEHECQVLGHDLVITYVCIEGEYDNIERIQSICEEKCAGIILLGADIFSGFMELFENCASPLVSLDAILHLSQIHTVTIDNYNAGYLATTALINAKHSEIGVITSSIDTSSMICRLEGYKEAMEFYGLRVGENSIWRVTPSLDGSYRDIKKLLSEGLVPPTAFFAESDTIAVGSIRALNDMGYLVPKDISIIGVGDSSICQVCVPSLSTVQVHSKELGTAAVNVLFNIVGNLKNSIIKTEMSVSLVLRDSVARPRGIAINS